MCRRMIHHRSRIWRPTGLDRAPPNPAAVGLPPVPRLVVEPGPRDRRTGNGDPVRGGHRQGRRDQRMTRRYISVDGRYERQHPHLLVLGASTRSGWCPGAAARRRLYPASSGSTASSDIVVRDARVPTMWSPGDLLAVAATGAYCYSMSSRYNLIGRPAVVAVRDGHAADPADGRPSTTC